VFCTEDRGLGLRGCPCLTGFCAGRSGCSEVFCTEDKGLGPNVDDLRRETGMSIGAVARPEGGDGGRGLRDIFWGQ
jgi:hypothetical protein